MKKTWPPACPACGKRGANNAGGCSEHRSPLTSEERMSRLAESFPGLRGKTGVRPWDPLLLDDWAATVASSTETQIAAFVLEVWNMHEPWKCGPFRAVKAMAYWDGGNRQAFLAWAQNPKTE